MMVNPKRVLVTGGAGFIGSHLVDRLLGDGHEVVVLDNFITGRHENLSQHKGNTQFKVHPVDVAEYESIHPYFDRVEWVFHLASLADIVPSIKEPLQYHKANVDGTVSVLEASRAHNVKRFIYTASSSCYGIADQLPTPETASIEPEYPYALTKYIGEQYTMHWNRIYGLPCVSLRLFNVYGPRSRTSGAYGAVFGVFLAQKLAGKPLTVVGEGNQTRDFTFVPDVVDAFVQAAESQVQGEVFNVGSGGTYSINQLVELLDSEKIHIPKRPGEPDCTFADVTKISQDLGWEPKVAFDEGVKSMIDNIEMWRSAPVWDEISIAKATEDWFAYLGNSTGRE